MPDSFANESGRWHVRNGAAGERIDLGLSMVVSGHENDQKSLQGSFGKRSKGTPELACDAATPANARQTEDTKSNAIAFRVSSECSAVPSDQPIVQFGPIKSMPLPVPKPLPSRAVPSEPVTACRRRSTHTGRTATRRRNRSDRR